MVILSLKGMIKKEGCTLERQDEKMHDAPGCIYAVNCNSDFYGLQI